MFKFLKINIMIKRNRFFILLALIGLSVTVMFSSCQRQLKKADIKAIENTEEQNSMWCYFYNGYYLNQPLRARDNFLLQKKHYEKDAKWDSPKQYIGEKYLGQGDYIVLKGDMLIAKEIVWCSNGKTSSIIFDSPFAAKNDWIETKFQVVRNGKVAGEGWIDFTLVRSSSYLAPYTWTAMFGSWKVWIAWFIILGGLIVLAHRFWFVRPIRKDAEEKNEPDETKGIYLTYVFALLSLLLGIEFIYLYFNPSEVAALYFNPNIFAHWSEYAPIVKAFPFLLILFVASAVGMFFQMKKKMSDIGMVIIHFIGWLAMGFFVMGAILFVAISLYALFLFLLPAAFFLFKGFGSGGGGSGSSGGSKGPEWLRDKEGVMHTSGVSKDSANKKIEERRANN
jgi:hypothetical protein